MSIRAENLVWSVGKIRIIDGVSLSVRPGKVLGVGLGQRIGQVVATASAGGVTVTGRWTGLS